MKKKFFFAVATIVAAVSVGYAAYLNQKVEISDALLENIEALSDEESEFSCFMDEEALHICNIYDKAIACPCGF